MVESHGLVVAHGVGSVYELPLPLPLYLGGAATTVLASFAIRAVVGRTRRQVERLVVGRRAAGAFVQLLRVGALVAFVITLVFAVLEPAGGLTVAPLLFWIGLFIGTTLMSSLVGDIWIRANPWRTIEGLYRIGDEDVRGGDPPWWLGPLLVYALFWFELVSGRGFEPATILLVLLGYSVYVLGFRSASRWDADAADPFSILFGFASRVAPFKLDERGLVYRGLVAGLDEESAMPKALFASLFVLLGSTTLDNVRETVGWHDFLADTGLADLPDMVIGSLALAFFTLPFFLLFVAAVWVARRWSVPRISVGEASRRFGWSLIPIGIAYVLAHNMPLLMTGLPILINEVFDFTGTELVSDYSPSPKLVWFLEIGLIVGGHVLGVLAAHRIALRMSGSHAGAIKSHTALTALMGLFTISTLWLLSLPLVEG